MNYLKSTGKADAFNSQEFVSLLKTPLTVFSKLLHYKKISSTQDKLKKLADKYDREGLVAVADEQTAGYGRLKRKWSSNFGGLWFSLLLKPRVSPEEVSQAALLISIALNKVLQKHYGVKTLIKWPNDILFNDKKLAGILIEMSAEQDKVNWLVAGIGVNINNRVSGDFASNTASVGEIIDKSVSRAEFLALFLKEFDKIYLKFQLEGFKPFKDYYNKKSAYMGQKLKILSGSDEMFGINLGVDDHGKLIVKTSQGVEKIISATIRSLK